MAAPARSVCAAAEGPGTGGQLRPGDARGSGGSEHPAQTGLRPSAAIGCEAALGAGAGQWGRRERCGCSDAGAAPGRGAGGVRGSAGLSRGAGWGAGSVGAFLGRGPGGGARAGFPRARAARGLVPAFLGRRPGAGCVLGGAFLKRGPRGGARF